MTQQPYAPFIYQPDYDYQAGWDAFALDYATLLQPNTVYTLTKEVMYKIVEQHVQLKPGMRVLDVNCGTGNDFPYFLSKECLISGCDVSTGMLNKAVETYTDELKSGTISLYQGALEELNTSHFEPNSFDIIYSITGGFSYIDHAEMKRVFQTLRHFLKPGGKIITAHFGRFAVAESLFYLKRGRLKEALIRRKRTLHVPIKNQRYTMYLQRYQWLVKLFETDFSIDNVHPLLYATPPYQTKFKPGVDKLNQLRKREFNNIHKKRLSNFSDQFVIVLSKK